MRLGYLVPEFPRQTHAFFWREVCALREEGVDVVLLSTRRPREDCPHAFSEPARRETTYLVPPGWDAVSGTVHGRGVLRSAGYVAGLNESVWHRKLRYLAALPVAAALARVMKRRGIDHLHVHSCADAAHLAAMAHRMVGTPYSLRLHGDLPVYGVDHASKTRDAAFVAPVTRALQSQLIETLGLSSDRVPLLPMGVNIDRFCPDETRSSTDGCLRLASVARLQDCKGHTFALQALRRALDAGVDAGLVLAGDGPERANIEQQIGELGLEERVRLLGSVGEDRVLELLRGSDALILPSVGLGEAAPVAVMEAMACGLPVISSVIGGTPDMIDDRVDGFLVGQRDVAALADRIATLAQQPDLRERLGRAARDRAVRSFSDRAWARRLLAKIQGARAAAVSTGVSGPVAVPANA